MRPGRRDGVGVGRSPVPSARNELVEEGCGVGVPGEGEKLQVPARPRDVEAQHERVAIGPESSLALVK